MSGLFVKSDHNRTPTIIGCPTVECIIGSRKGTYNVQNAAVPYHTANHALLTRQIESTHGGILCETVIPTWPPATGDITVDL
jgi:hypothetical protein